MLEIRERCEAEGASEPVELTLTLPFDSRQRSRLRVVLSDGRVAGLALPRGSVLRGGDLLRSSEGRVVRVVSAPEAVSTARSSAQRALMRAAYHLGNRHVPLEIGDGFVRYLHDHVLDAMVRDLGLSVEAEQVPFEPEGGAYARGHSHNFMQGHHHSHDHDHNHHAHDE
jgi:urease accessory protein